MTLNGYGMDQKVWAMWIFSGWRWRPAAKSWPSPEECGAALLAFLLPDLFLRLWKTGSSPTSSHASFALLPFFMRQHRENKPAPVNYLKAVKVDRCGKEMDWKATQWRLLGVFFSDCLNYHVNVAFVYALSTVCAGRNEFIVSDLYFISIEVGHGWVSHHQGLYEPWRGNKASPSGLSSCVTVAVRKSFPVSLLRSALLRRSIEQDRNAVTFGDSPPFYHMQMLGIVWPRTGAVFGLNQIVVPLGDESTGDAGAQTDSHDRVTVIVHGPGVKAAPELSFTVLCTARGHLELWLRSVVVTWGAA